MQCNDSSGAVIRRKAREYWKTWGRTGATQVLRGAGSAAGATLFFLVIAWLQSR